MFKFFNSSNSQDEIQSEEQAVIVTVVFQSDSKLGDRDDHDMLRQLEGAITDILDDTAELDGHEVGEGEAVLYIYGPSAEHIWTKIEHSVRSSKFKSKQVTLRFGSATDPQVKSKVIKL
ncbi:hypothetical protein KA047_02230 [Candidatus Saccharibacteria bacterium]|nr:hypothetical protein [Candidatus Saccharibacteria bacterium]